MSVSFVAPTTFNPTADNAYHDVASGAPTGATGVMLLIQETSGFSNTIGIRAKGSTDTYTHIFSANTQTWMYMGLDSSGNFQVQCGRACNIIVYGFFGTESTFLANAQTQAVTAATWTDVVLTSLNAGAIAAIGFVGPGAGSGYKFGARMKGSTDNHSVDDPSPLRGFIVGLDSNQTFQAFANGADTFYIQGYMTSGVVCNVNGIDRSTTTAGSYVTNAALPGGSIGGVYEFTQVSSALSNAMRANGSSQDLYGVGPGHGFIAIGCDGSQLTQQKVSLTTSKLYELASFTAAKAATPLLTMLTNQGGF